MGWPAQVIWSVQEGGVIGWGFAERMEIMRGRDIGLSYAEIGRRIGRDRSVIWREVQRNRLPDGDYHASMAHARAAEHARRPKAFRLANPRLRAMVASWMDDGWSPKLISTVLKHPRFRAHLVTCGRCALRSGVERSTRPRLLPVDGAQGGA